MIWDMHCHLSGVSGATPHERIAQLIRIADRLGIERLVLSMGMTWHLDPSPDEFRKQNDEVLEALSHWHDRAFGLVYLNPKHVDASLVELDRCVRSGPMIGIKLWVAVRCNDMRLDPIIVRAIELKAVVFQHTWLKSGGNYPGESTPMDLAELATRHPQATFVCGHSGGDWERGIRAVRPHNNVSVETAGFDPTSGMVEMAVRELGVERTIYGSDAGGRSFASQIAKVRAAMVSENDKQSILGGNLKRLLRPILLSKRIDV